MNTMDVMREYNEYERIKISAFGGKRVTSPEVVKFVANDVNGSFISYFDLNAANADVYIEREIQFFRELGRNFEWKTYSTDSPSNIGELLSQKGLVRAETESFMVLDLASVNEPEVGSVGFVEVSDSKGISDVFIVQEAVRGESCQWMHNHLRNLKKQSPEAVSIYVVYADGVPVTSAWITFNGDSPFAGIWGGCTIKSHREKGYYSMLLNKRISEAKSRGKKYLNIDASAMSKPIVEKYGFKFVAKTVGYNFEIK